MLVYDITQDKSFENISKWLRNIEEHANEDVEKMILGNKCDMEDKRVVSKDRGTSVSGCQGLQFNCAIHWQLHEGQVHQGNFEHMYMCRIIVKTYVRIFS